MGRHAHKARHGTGTQLDEEPELMAVMRDSR